MAKSMMKILFALIFSSVVLCTSQLVKRDLEPNLPWDLKTTPYCTYWFDYYEEPVTCQKVMKDYGVTLEKMTRWNPSLKAVSGACTGWTLYQSYCVQAYLEPGISSTSKSSTATTTKKSTTSTTTSRPTATSWTLLGCYLDAGSSFRTLSHDATPGGGDSRNSIDWCQQTCWNKGYIYAGVEFSSECYCGNSIRNELAPDAASTCTMKCVANSAQLCGGNRRVHVFKGNAPKQVSSTTTKSSTSKATSSPTPTTVPMRYNPLGCYPDPSNNRSLQVKLTVPGGDDSMTVDACHDACGAGSYLYSGVEYGVECRCGNTIRPAPVNETDCSMPCSGNPAQICGGPNRLSLYKWGPLPKPKTWKPLGCYYDPSNARTLPTLVEVVGGGTTLTIEKCHSACEKQDYKFAAVEYRNECRCGNTLRSGTNNGPSPPGDCDLPCNGNPSQICGGANRMNVYEQVLISQQWISLGCYTHLSQARVLTIEVLLGQLTTMTIDSCKTACAAEGYSYSGLTRGNRCFCDKAMANSVLAPEGSAACNTICAGNAAETCGGTNRMSVYYLPQDG